MFWVATGLSAGLVLGLYDFLTKIALKRSGAIEVTFFSCLIGGLVWLPFWSIPGDYLSWLKIYHLHPPSLSLNEQILILPKSFMMVATWTLSYYSVKALPLSISAGVRASGPLWTALAALLFLGEHLSLLQWSGIFIAMLAYYCFSLIGSREGISFKNNIWVIAMLLATLLSSANAIYDKYIISDMHMDLSSVQAYSALQRALIGLPLVYAVMSRSNEIHLTPRDKAAIFFVGFSYVVAEYIYLLAVNYPGSLISIISVLRRTNLLVVFGLSALLLREKHIKAKLGAIVVVMLGIVLTIL